MSAIASFVRLPKNALGGLRDAAVPKKRIFGAPKDTFDDYLRAHGNETTQYQWSGLVLATLLPYLHERHQIDLMKSEYDELAAYLCKAREATFFVFTQSHKAAFFERLDPALFSEANLRQYFNEFNEANEQQVGKAMLDGVSAFRQALGQVNDESVVLFSIR